ncbi:MAG: hypothetical protein IKP00_15250 [Victivallales bacterium]|nr:hypothetical protein [Victivallales bacterium]
MKRILPLLFTIVVCAWSQLDTAMPSRPWFDHVRIPAGLSQQELCDLTSALREALKGKSDAKQIGLLAPEDNLARVVFITIGGEKWPGRTYFGTGRSFRNALTSAVDILLSNEPVFASETIKLADATIGDMQKTGQTIPQEWLERKENPTQWNWLRLEVVQAAKPTFGFSVRRSRIALGCLVGFAFGPDLGFAFTPSQVTARNILDDTAHINTQQVGNLISETYNWPALKMWMKLCAVDAGHRICLFETDSFYSDGATTVRLYRGHTLQNELPTTELCVNLASRCADRIAARLTDEGAFPPPVPEWLSTYREKNMTKSEKKKRAKEETEQGGVRGDESLEVKAELAIALCRLARVTNNPAYNDAALKALKPILASMRKSRDGRVAVVEDEELPESSHQLPDKVALLSTNALTCLALLEMKENGIQTMEAQDTVILNLASHLAAQLETGCDFAYARYWKTGKNALDENQEMFANVEETALAILALNKTAEALGKPELKKDDALNTLMELKLAKPPMESVNTSPWFAEALASSDRTDKEYTLSLRKLGFAVSTATDTAPLYPDYYGSVKRRPGCTTAAERSWLLAVLSRKLRSYDKPMLAQEQLQEAMPVLMFQVQASIDFPSSSLLPNPAAYVSYFRDNLENYCFTMSGQVAQMMSLMAVAQEIKETGNFNGTKFLPKLMASRRETDVHPGPVSIDLVLTLDNDPDANARDLMGGFSKTRQVRRRSKIKGK